MENEREEPETHVGFPYDLYPEMEDYVVKRRVKIICCGFYYLQNIRLG
jgi:hypothetical protein